MTAPSHTAMKSIFLLFVFVALEATAVTSRAAPLSPMAHPRTFCELAADAGYPSRGFKEHAGTCASNMADVTPTPGRNGLKNNLAFYSMGHTGNTSKLLRVSLILNVNNVREKAKAHSELARVAKSVAAKLLGEVPPQLGAVVESAGSKTWFSGSWALEVKSNVWPTGLGHDITVYFRPK